jgi:hypothetical protein
MLCAELSSESDVSCWTTTLMFLSASVSSSVLMETGGLKNGFGPPPNASILDKTSSSTYGSLGPASSSYGCQFPNGPVRGELVILALEHSSPLLTMVYTINAPPLNSGTMMYSLTALLAPIQISVYHVLSDLNLPFLRRGNLRRERLSHGPNLLTQSLLRQPGEISRI